MKTHLKNHAILLIVTLSLYSCREESEPNYRLKSFNADLLVFDELDYGAYSKTYNPEFSGKITLQYNDRNQVTQTTGGLATVAAGANTKNVCLSNGVVDKIQHSNNCIATENEFPYKTYGDTTLYYLNNGQLTRKIVIKKNPDYTLDYSYVYDGNKIMETLNGLLQTSIIYLSNNNVTKIECFTYNNSKEIIYKKEIIFSSYDQSKNLLKGLYYIHGAFYNAFSTNNYRKREIKTYSYSNDQYSLLSTSTDSICYNIDSNNIPDLFEYESY